MVPVPFLDLREGHAELLADSDLRDIVPGGAPFEMHLKDFNLKGALFLLPPRASLQVLIVLLLDPEPSHGSVHLALHLLTVLEEDWGWTLVCRIVVPHRGVDVKLVCLFRFKFLLTAVSDRGIELGNFPCFVIDSGDREYFLAVYCFVNLKWRQDVARELAWVLESAAGHQ